MLTTQVLTAVADEDQLQDGSHNRQLLGQYYYYGYHNYHEPHAATAAAAAAGGDGAAASAAASSGMLSLAHISSTPSTC